jgi:hypothetical protein
MQALAGAAIAILIVVSVIVAVRLLALSRRTGAAPERLLGGMLFLSVGIGYPLLIAVGRVGPAWVGTFFVVSALAVNIGFSLLFVFTWRVFHPEAAWAKALAGVGVLTLLLKAVERCMEVHTHGVVHVIHEPLSQSLLQTVPVMAAYAWTAWESLHYHGLMRRRVKIGLADATVSDRFLLWGLMGLFAAAGVLLNAVAIALHVEVFSNPWILLCSSATGMAQASLLVLAFLPPRSYLGWVRARAAAAEARDG